MTASLQGRAATTVRTMGRVMFVDPVRAGRLRVAGLTPLTRGLAILGVGTLGMLLVSLILNDLWRRGPLALVRDFEATPNLAAKGVVSFTVVALAIAWVLILVGGALARPPVAVVAAVAFLLGNTSMSEVLTRGDSTALRMLPDVVAACYFAAPALLVALSCLRLTERWRGVRPVLGVALAAAGIAFFAAHLAIFVLEERAGNPSILPRQLDGAMNGLQGFLVPLFVLAVAALVQLNHQVTRAVTTPFWTLSTRVAKLAVLLLVAVKLRYALDGRVDEWTAYVVERRPQAVQAAGFVLLLALAALLFRRLGEERPPEVPTDGVVFAGSALLATTVVVTGIILSGATFLARVGPGEPDRWVLEHFPFRFMGKYLTLTVFAVVFIIGLSLVVRPRPPPRGRHLGAVLVLLGAWIIPSLVLQQLSDRDVGFNIGLVDLALTLAALVYLVVRWRHLDTAAAVRLGSLLVFASLVTGNGYVATRLVSRVLGVFTPPAVLLIVMGVIYVVLADSAFASTDSRNFPRHTRVLLWLGYLIFVVAVTNYVLVARESEYRIEFDRYAFHFLALPLAVWLAVRSRFAPPPPAQGEDEADRLNEVPG